MKEITELGVVKIESNIPMDTNVDWNEIRNRYVYELKVWNNSTFEDPGIRDS